MKKTKLAIAIAAATLISAPAYATNGMNMEGYGPISSGMGGTAQAYNNGLGGMMNNPATMGMGAEEGNKFQIGIGNLRPDVSAKHSMGIDQDSDGDSYFMPGFGYARKLDGITWGIGILGQGGMGTEYGDNAGPGDVFFSGSSMMNNNQTNQTFNPMTDSVMLSGQENRSELSVGRILLPVNMEVNDKLTIGGSLDLVWAGLDIMMDMSGQQFANLAYNDFATPNQAPSGNVSGTMLSSGGDMNNPGLMEMIGSGMVTDVNYARFDFSDNSDYTGQAKGYGLGGKLGLTYQISDQLTFGASYHTKTNLSDLKGDANLSMSVDMNGMGTQVIPVEGEIKVRDFQWPETIAMGVAYKPNDQWLVTADYKRINWSDVMDGFNMTFHANETQSNPMAAGFAGKNLDVTLPQNWDDQNVFMLGSAYKMNKQLTLRAGLNVANNPIPEKMTNPLFPATIEKHYTVGFGYKFDKAQSIDFSLAHAPTVTVTNAEGLDISHSQTNWQLLYTYKWGITPKK